MTEWNQTPTSVTLSIALPYRVDPKKFESLITENFVKLNIPEIKLFKFIDLFAEVLPGESNIVIEDKRILFYLTKVKEEQWEGLEYKCINKSNYKEELKERRKVAEANHERRVKLEQENAKERTIEFEKFVVDKSIKLDEEKRKELREKKNVEKSEAEREIYKYFDELKQKEIEGSTANTNNANNNASNIANNHVNNNANKNVFGNENNNTNNIVDNNLKDNANNHVNNNANNNTSNIVDNHVNNNANINVNNNANNNTSNIVNNNVNNNANNKVNNKANNNTNDIAINNVNNTVEAAETMTYKKGNKNEIFDEEILTKYEVESNKVFPDSSENKSNNAISGSASTSATAPDKTIRQPANIKVNLTEKAIPHFAARESLNKEPPYPKSKKYVPEKNMVKNQKKLISYLDGSRNRR